MSIVCVSSCSNIKIQHSTTSYLDTFERFFFSSVFSFLGERERETDHWHQIPGSYDPDIVTKLSKNQESPAITKLWLQLYLFNFYVHVVPPLNAPIWNRVPEMKGGEKVYQKKLTRGWRDPIEMAVGNPKAPRSDPPGCSGCSWAEAVIPLAFVVLSCPPKLRAYPHQPNAQREKR